MSQCTDSNYDVGKERTDERVFVYPAINHNLKIFDEVKRLKAEIDKIEEKQIDLCRKLEK